MKPREKKVVMITLAALAGFLVLTVVLEVQYSKEHSRFDARRLAGESDYVGAGLDKYGPGIRLIPKGINLNDLPEPHGTGVKLLNLYCVQCHDLPVPQMHGIEGWTRVLARMKQHMKGKGGGLLRRIIMPSKEKWDEIEDYLTRYAQKSLDTGQITDLDTPQAQTFLTQCSQCHYPPDPKQHRPNEWPRIVVRMHANMREAGVRELEDAEQKQIIEYLQKHST